jgi:phage recombination protein Bet
MTSELAIRDSQEGWSPEQVAALHQLGVKDASPGDLKVFFHQSVRSGLDPFAKQIYMIGRKSKRYDYEARQEIWETKQTIQTAIDGFRLIARRAADRAKHRLAEPEILWCGEDGIWRDVWLPAQPPSAAKATVLRDGEPFVAVALYREYVQTQGKENKPNSMWSRMPANQLAKCAEALALRKAFPQDLSGLYTDDEMGQSDGELAEVGQPSVENDKQVEERRRKRMFALFGDLGLKKREEMLDFSGEVVGRILESSKDLTAAEVERVITELEAEQRTQQNAAVEVVDAEVVEDGPMFPDPTSPDPKVDPNTGEILR